MEVVERTGGATAFTVQPFQRPVQRDLIRVLQRTPPINYSVRFDLDLVKHRVPGPSVLWPAHGSQICAGNVRRCDEDRPTIRDERLMEVHVGVVRDIIPTEEQSRRRIPGQRDPVDPLVGLVQDIDRAVPETPGILVGDTVPIAEHRTALQHLRAEPESHARGTLPDQLAVVRDDQGRLVLGPRARRADEEVPVGCSGVAAVPPGHLEHRRMEVRAAEALVWPDDGSGGVGGIGVVCRGEIRETNGCKSQGKDSQPSLACMSSCRTHDCSIAVCNYCP